MSILDVKEMTNDKCLMTKEGQNPNDERKTLLRFSSFVHSDFTSSFVIRALSFFSHRIDFIKIDKILDVHRLRRFQIDALKIFVFQDDGLPFLVIITFHDLVPWHLFAVGFRDPFVIDGTQIFRPQQAKSKLLFPRRRIKGDGNVDETETDAAFPNCAHTQLFRTASRICADEDADLANWRALLRQCPNYGTRRNVSLHRDLTLLVRVPGAGFRAARIGGSKFLRSSYSDRKRLR